MEPHKPDTPEPQPALLNLNPATANASSSAYLTTPVLLKLGPATVRASATLDLKVMRGSAEASGGDVTIYPPAATATASMRPPTVTVSKGMRLDLSVPH